ncbi:MAG TPA: histidinol dehydrogenase [Solirubrobacteraceae bacterium]|nr:histidinol dehydrogenase [Solirubrobacteraceae bacterium]
MRTRDFGPSATAQEIRALTPDSRDVEDGVREIVARVRRGGDAAVCELIAEIDEATVTPGRLRVERAALAAAAAGLGPPVAEGLRTAIANVRAVAEAQLRDRTVVDLPEGQAVDVEELPVRRVGIYAPAGRAAYPSSVVMAAATARAAGVDEIAVCAGPGPDGEIASAILAACALCGVEEVYRAGGAQAIAALAYGTETIAAVDVIAGPGGSWVQEAKRQVFGQVGIDGIAGPSELVVVSDGDADAEPLALDLLAQAEHGPDSLVVAISQDADMLELIAVAVERLAAERPSVQDAPLALVRTETVQDAVALADAIAPEHLQLVGPLVEALAETVRAAGCVFVGPAAGTAFGDYVAGSNHILPTGGAARFQSAVSPTTFRRRMARVSLPADAAARLAAKGAPLARAEGFPVHAESMERRA